MKIDTRVSLPDGYVADGTSRPRIFGRVVEYLPDAWVVVQLDSGERKIVAPKSVRIEAPDFNADRAVLVAADSWPKLRRIDVYRLFDSHEPDHWTPILRVLKARRPDLLPEARECLADLEADMHSTRRPQ